MHYDGHAPSVEGVGVSGEVGTCVLQCTFDSVWSAYPNRTAILVSSFGVFAETLDAENRIVVPASVVPKGDEAVRVSVFGTAQAQSGAVLRYNGEPIRIRFYAGGETAKILTEPEMTAYERLLARLTDVEHDLGESITQSEQVTAQAQSATAEAVTAAQNAEDAADTATAATDAVLTATENAIAATEDALTAAQNAVTATVEATAATAEALTAAQEAETAAAEARLVAVSKADKVSGATAGNLAGLNSEGNLIDSGIASAGEVWTFVLADGSTVSKRVLTAAVTEGE